MWSFLIGGRRNALKNELWSGPSRKCSLVRVGRQCPMKPGRI